MILQKNVGQYGVKIWIFFSQDAKHVIHKKTLTIVKDEQTLK